MSPPSTSFVQSPGGRLAVRRWGTPGKPIIVLVHGYPDNSSKWDAVARHLGDDFDVVAYDVRGAGDSFVPPKVADYKLARLTEDFTAVINAVSPDAPVHLVAHDWGSVQSWKFVTEPALKGRIASYTSCSGPSLDHVGFWLRDKVRHPTLRGLGQLGMQGLKSWYVYFFQLPWLPEALWRKVLGRHWPGLMRFLEGTHIEPRASQAEDGANGVNLYRANVFARFMRPRERFAHVPVQLLVATQDHFVSPALTSDLERWVPQLTRREVKAGHWVTIKQPELFASAVRDFINKTTPTPRTQPFDEQLLGVKLKRENFGGADMAVFPSDDGGIHGCLLAEPNVPLDNHGAALVYLNANPKPGRCPAPATGHRIAQRPERGRWR